MTQHTKSINIPMSAADIYELLLDVENFHEFWPYVKSAEPISRHKSYWTMVASDGTLLYWDEKMTLLEEDSRIAWRSKGGDVSTSGLVTLEEIEENETKVSLTLHAVAGHDSTFERAKVAEAENGAVTFEDRQRLIGGVEMIIDKGAYSQDEPLNQLRGYVAQHGRHA